MRRSQKARRNLRHITTVLSLVVIFSVFWSLKLTGIGIAGEAFCGKAEHTHGEECLSETLVCLLEAGDSHTHEETCYEVGEICALEEHTHIESCYSDITADLETSDDWEMTLADMSRGPTVKKNVVLVAQSQLGYTESTLNFQVDDGGIRRGITRYGQWYGNPYGDWSTMFISFCLDYAGAEDVPMNAGPEAMRLEWEAAGLYRPADQQTPEIGDLVFLSKGEQATGAATAAAIITGVDETGLTVIEGDLDNAVAETRYEPGDTAILGYGFVPEKEPEILYAPAPQAVYYTIWLDGTDGGLSYLSGSPNVPYTVQGGSTMTLPAAWTSPSKYSYKLRGWYDITTGNYYPAGAEMVVTGDTVLYADWVASTYDLGVFNAQVHETDSTNSFVTTHVFDYNYLFNIHSSRVQVSVNPYNHTETWSMITSGNVNHDGAPTYNFIFSDNDESGRLNMPNDRSSGNMYHEATTVSPGIYSPELGEKLFATDNAYDPETGEGVLGKTYLGTGDYLFRIMDDPTDEHYGYYYYDSKRNAASYNQSNGRFYVYDYLSATSDSLGGAYSDFLPLNSPYANTNGKQVGAYDYAGVNGEYGGVRHYRYDSKYDTGDYNSTNGVYADYAYGMRIDVTFYLPNAPGSGGNKDMYGNDMQFQFSGDDDLWVLIDGVVALDIGGIHQIVSGSIDFSTGQVMVNGTQQTSLMNLGIGAGDHTMTVLYLERGASMSNCAIYFNLAPRFGLQLQKEDVLTQELLDGAQFSVYEDLACTVPAELWASEGAYNRDIADGVLDQAQNTFTVTGGTAYLWGLGAGNTYYIKETGAPNKEGYGIAQGVIRLTVERDGMVTDLADVITGIDGKKPSNGFTVHGAKIDEETQMVYLVVTNAPETVTETTTVQVLKQWEDATDHSEDYITAYLTVTDPDGTIRRIREVILGDENDWMYIWTNLPKYDYEALAEVQYGVEESYESGYYSTARQITELEITRTRWAEALSFRNGETYLIRTANGYLATQDNRADTGYRWVDEQTAQDLPNALWTAAVNGTAVKLTNGVGQTITFYYNNGNPTDFYAKSDAPQSVDRQEFSYSSYAGGLQLCYQQNGNNYYLAKSWNSSQKFGYTGNRNDALVLTPLKKITTTTVLENGGWAYQITNTPLAADNETSLSVKKNWVIPEGYSPSLYQEYAVTVRLFANGTNTGRSLTLNLKNNWQGEFLGLPYKDDSGKVIEYTVDEVWQKAHWTTSGGEVGSTGGSPPVYSAVITNTYHPNGPSLPSTGSAARLMYVLCGSGMMLGSLVYGIGSRRKRERRMK